MNFWKNERYKSFENITRTGDPIRGETFQNFPWHLASANIHDPQQDPWELSIHCISVVPAKIGNEVTATLEASARCKLSNERLKALGYSPERLEWLGLDPHEILSERVSAEVKLKLEQLELVAKGNLKKFEAYITKNYNENRKSEMIRNRIDSSRFSRFETNNSSNFDSQE